MSRSDGWFTSSFTNGDCVQVKLRGGVLVRHSKDPTGSVLHFTDHEWVAFLEGVRNGEFDLPSHPPRDADGTR